jgi:homopolymeric O-antigen transport system permease protein
MTRDESRQRGNQRRWQHAWDLLVLLVQRDLQVQYRRSSLGIGWTLAGPLLQLVTFTLVFRRVLSIRIENYASFVFIGVLVWGWFQSALTQSTGVITGSRSLVLQPGFPLALLPHVTVGVRLFHFMVALPFLVFLLWWQGISPAWSWCALPLLVVIQYVLTVGLAYPLASLNVSFRDIQHIIAVLLQLMIFVTPVFYSPQAVPDRFRTWWQVNPMVGMLHAWRTVLMEGQWPNVGELTALLLCGCLLLALGRRVFVFQSHRFAEEM